MGGSAREDRSILLQLNLWSFGLLLVSLALNVAWLSSRFGTSKVLPSVLEQLSTAPAVLLDGAWFLLACVLVHAALASAWFVIWRRIDARWLARFRAQRGALATLSFLVVLLGVLLANAALYPRSSFAAYDTATGAAWTAAAAVAIGACVLVAVFAALPRRARWIVALATLVVVAWHAVDADGHPAASGRSQPDVIVIGVDSLRVDHVGTPLTPSLNAALDGATVVADAWTPLGRTFPAWVSILTGRYPSTHGAEFNLIPRELVDADDSLAHDLGARGYERLYAIDETRFSNLDAGFGFDRIVTPAIGAFDFAAGAVGDLPLVNLVKPTRLGAWLFPYLHMNRGHAVAYRPRVFDAALARAVHDVDATAPLFLVAHFELPHWPYHWAASEPEMDALTPTLVPLTPASYRAAVAEADRQVGALLRALESAGRLEHAVVVLLSDHGESFRGSEPAWPGMTPSAGHGTNVLSVAQNRVLLAFRAYGVPSPDLRAHETASLVDVRPTLADWLGLPPSRPVDGVSLLARTHHAPRAVTIETGYSPEALHAGVSDAMAVVEQGAANYEIRADGRAALRADFVARLRALKQRAAISGDWMLVAMPVPGAAARLMVVDLGSGGLAGLADGAAPDDAPIDLLLDALCARAALPECG